MIYAGADLKWAAILNPRRRKRHKAKYPLSQLSQQLSGFEPLEDITIYTSVASMTSTGNTSCCVSHATKIFLIVSLELYGVSSYDVTAVGSQWGAWQTANSQREPGERLKIEVCQALTVMTSLHTG